MNIQKRNTEISLKRFETKITFTGKRYWKSLYVKEEYGSVYDPKHRSTIKYGAQQRRFLDKLSHSPGLNPNKHAFHLSK